MIKHFYCVGRQQKILYGTASFTMEAAIKKSESYRSAQWSVLRLAGWRLWEVVTTGNRVVVTVLTGGERSTTLLAATYLT